MRVKDVYELMNSKAIEKHCRSINHEFNTEELTVLIFRNKKLSIEDKILAYEELIEKYPDMEVIKRINCNPYSSVKTLIKDEIKRLQYLLLKFNKQEDDVIYSYVPFYKSTEEYATHEAFYNSCKTLKEIHDNIEENINEYDDFFMYNIHKKKLSNSNHNITAEYIVNNKKSIIVNIYEHDGSILDIEGICLNIPTPFKRGDILCYSTVPFVNGTILQGRGKPFVLDWMITWKEGFAERLKNGNYDESDMYGTGYYIADTSTTSEGKEVYLDHVFYYDSWEYFDFELEGMERILKGVSSLITDKIELMLFLHAYEQIKFEESIKPNLNWFTKEGLELAGIKREDEKSN